MHETVAGEKIGEAAEIVEKIPLPPQHSIAQHRLE